MHLLERLESLPAYEREELAYVWFDARKAYAGEVNPYLGQENDLETAWDMGHVAYADDVNPFVFWSKS